VIKAGAFAGPAMIACLRVALADLRALVRLGHRRWMAASPVGRASLRLGAPAFCLGGAWVR